MISQDKYNQIPDHEKGQFLLYLIEDHNVTSNHYMAAYNTPNPVNQQKGHWKVELQRDLQFKGFCNYRERKIVLDSSQKQSEALSTLIFELANATHSAKFYPIDEALIKKEIGCEEYAKAMEQVEYESAQKHAQIIQKTWTKFGFKMQTVEPDFESYWEQIKKSEHTEYYRKSWGKITGQMRSV